MTVLVALFALTALLYASVGFGGGSTYTALLAVGDADYAVLPLVSLACNLVVVVGGVIRFARAGEIPWAKALPLCAFSVPLAWVGGYVAVPEVMFVGLLAASLFIAGLLMLGEWQSEPMAFSLSSAASVALPTVRRSERREVAIGGGLGLLSGMVGIGGGIFLSPILHLTGWGRPRAIAGTASLFILVNSAAGIAGHLVRLDTERVAEATAYWPLFVAVLIGGQIGSRLGVQVMPQRWLKILTAILVLFVSIRLFFRFVSMTGDV